MRWMETLPTATLGRELGTVTRSVKKMVDDVGIMSARTVGDECRMKGGVSMEANAPVPSSNPS